MQLHRSQKGNRDHQHVSIFVMCSLSQSKNVTRIIQIHIRRLKGIDHPMDCELEDALHLFFGFLGVFGVELRIFAFGSLADLNIAVHIMLSE